MGEQISQLILSKPAILVGEVLVVALLLFGVIRLTKKRNKNIEQDTAMQEQKKWKSFDDSLKNQKRG